MMKQQIDMDRVVTATLPPSPRDGKVQLLGIVSIIFYVLAGICAWQFGGWWGVGLVGSMYIIDTLDDMVHEEHRQELIEGHSKLVMEIAENSDILDNVIPKKNRSTRSS